MENKFPFEVGDLIGFKPNMQPGKMVPDWLGLVLTATKPYRSSLDDMEDEDGMLVRYKIFCFQTENVTSWYHYEDDMPRWYLVASPIENLVRHD